MNFFQNSTASYNSKHILAILFVLVSLICVMSLVNVQKENEILKNQLNNKIQQLQQQALILDSAEKCNLILLLNDMFDKIDDELSSNPKRQLNDNTIERITELNYSFQPLMSAQGDSTSFRNWSPERGQLLRRLAALNLDSSTYNQIKKKTSFQGADLREMNLSGLDLTGIDLKNANLYEADLSGAKLSNSVLSDANLWGADLQTAKLNNSILHRADLRWADLSKADLSYANLNGANLNDAKLEAANLHAAELEWAKVRNAYLNETNLSESKLKGTDFGNSNLTKTNFSQAGMQIVNLSDAIIDSTNFSEAVLSKATVFESNWLTTLEEKKTIGAKDVVNSYKIIVEPSGKYNFRIVAK